MTETSQKELEDMLMDLLLQGDHPFVIGLRQQYAAARVIGREFTGVGFFTTFDVPTNIPAVSPQNYSGGNVDIELENLPNGAGCVLFARDGRLDILECYTNTDPWPERIVVNSLSNAFLWLGDGNSAKDPS